MIQCTCGKTLDKVPAWLASAKVTFVCNNCPDRQAKNIALLSKESEMPKTPQMDEDLDGKDKDKDSDEDED